MKASHVLLALAAIGVPAVGYAWHRRSKSAPAPTQPPSTPSPSVGAIAPAPAAPPASSSAAVGPITAAVQPPAQVGGVKAPTLTGGDVLQTAAKLVAGGAAAATVSAGLAAQKLQAAVVGVLGGNQATQDAVKVLGVTATTGFLAQQGAVKLTEALGAPKEVSKAAGQVAGVGVVVGAVLGAPAVVGVAALKGAAELGSAAIGAVFGKAAEKEVRNVVSQADPFKNGSLANQALQTVATTLFGPPPSPPAPPKVYAADPNANRGAGQVANDKDRAALAQKAAVVAEKKSGGGGIRPALELE